LRRDEVTGTLVETLVASYLHRVTIALRMPYSINYDPKKEGVDFVLKNIVTGETIPIEDPNRGNILRKRKRHQKSE